MKSVFTNDHTYVAPVLDFYQNIILNNLYLSSSPFFSPHDHWSSASTYLQANSLYLHHHLAICTRFPLLGRLQDDTQHGAGNTKQGSVSEKDYVLMDWEAEVASYVNVMLANMFIMSCFFSLTGYLSWNLEETTTQNDPLYL